MLAIYKRELKAFFNTMIGWIFIAAILFINGIYLIAVNLMGGYSNISYTISNSLFVYIIAIPLLTMRILTEERKQKIDQLIFTAPVSLWKIVTGKYLAMCTVLLMPLLVICVYPLVLSSYGNVSFAEAYIAVLGFLLYGMASIAMCLFLSSLTESIVIAAVLSFAAMFVTYIMQGLVTIITTSENFFTKILATVLNCFNFGTNFDDLLNGILDLRAVIYFVIIILVFLFLTTQVIQKRRFTVSKNTIGVGVYSTSLIAIVVAAAVVVNLIVADLPDKYMSIDVTNENLYSITDTTQQFLANLDEDVHLYVIQDENSKDEIIDKTIRQYAQNSSHITYEYKDPAKYPSFYKQYGDSSMSYNSIIVVGQNRYKVVDASDMYITEVDYSTYTSTVTGYDGEGQLTSAIDYVTMDNMPVAYNITGHSEAEIGSNFKSVIDKMNVELTDINLMKIDEIPDDVQFVMIIAPQTDFSSDDTEKILNYVKKGGKLYVCTTGVEDETTSLDNFYSILKAYGVSLIPGTIVEQDSNYYYQSPLFLLPEVNYSELTGGVYGEKYIFEPYAQGITVEESDDVTVDVLLQTSSNAAPYTEESISEEGTQTETTEAEVSEENKTDDETEEVTENTDETVDAVADETADAAAPYNLGSHITKSFDGTSSELMVFTSLNMLSDDADMMVSNANSTLFGNCVAQFVSVETGNISIPVKEYVSDILTIDSGKAILFGAFFTVMLPLALIVIGFVIWFRRRKK